MKKYVVLIISIVIFIVSFPLGSIFEDKLIFSINGPIDNNTNNDITSSEFGINKQNSIELRVKAFQSDNQKEKNKIIIKLISPSGKTVYYANSEYIFDVKDIKKEVGIWKCIIDKRKVHKGYYDFEVVEKK